VVVVVVMVVVVVVVLLLLQQLRETSKLDQKVTKRKSRIKMESTGV
jgi:uncharacterized membrane protein